MFSQAYNNANCLLGKPDPQTGTFSMVQDFGSLEANSGLGPSYQFSMGFSTLATLNGGNSTGMGCGFALKCGSYSASSGTITLSGGDSYKVLFAGSGKWVLSHKAQDITVEGNGVDEAYIYHKNGDVEFLKSDFTTGNTDMYLSRYTKADGRYLEFSYMYQTSYYRLVGVRDSDNQLATITYDSDNLTKVTVYPSSSTEKQEYTLNFNADGTLWALETPTGTINIDYKPITEYKSGLYMYPISKVTYPTGAIEEVEYVDNAMALPPDAPIGFMPALYYYTKTLASNQPAITTNYTYDSDFNYWGNNSGMSWTNNYDGLFNLTWAYRYSSTSTCGSKKTVTTYNKFHQTVETIETNGNESVTKTTTYGYYCDENAVLDDQEPRYELQKSKAMVVQDATGGTRTFTQTTDYDEYANLLCQVEPNGTSTVYEYYDAGGEDGCPASPKGLVGFKKSETMKPNDGTAGKTKTYRYKLIPAVDGNTSRCIVTDTMSCNGNTFAVAYHDSSNPKAQCQPKSQTITIGGKASTKQFEYTFDANGYTIKETMTGYDGNFYSNSSTLALFSGKTMQEVDRMGLITNYTYSSDGRVSKIVTSASTDYEGYTEYAYTQKPNENIGTLITQTTSTGQVMNIYYDGDEKELSTEKQDSFGNMRKSSDTSYDNQGRVVTETNYDYTISDQGIESTYTDSVTKVYGDWGEIIEEQHNGGATRIDRYTFDPVQLQRKHEVLTSSKDISVSGPVLTTYDLFGNEVQIDVLTLSGGIYSTTKKTYDGFGLLSSITTPMSATASTKYDVYERPIEATHFDGTVISMEYPDFTIKRLMFSVKLASSGYVLGQHEFDSLLRLISRTVGDVKTKFSYEAAYSKPSQLVNGLGQTVLFDYIPALGLQTAKEASFSEEVAIGDFDNPSKVSEKTFTYAKPSTSEGFLGRLVSASSPGSQHAVKYTSQGFIKSSTQTVGSLGKTLTNSKITFKGKPLNYSFDNRSLAVSYDKFGRIVSETDGEFSVDTSYDGVSRVTSVTVKKSGTVVSKTVMTYDDYSREASRTITCGGKTIVISQEYDLENKVTKRTTTIESSSTLTEDFTYDVKKRLSTYTATTSVSALLPHNEYGKAFKSQSFTYDELNNIKTLITKFSNGDSDTATYTYDSSKRFQLKQVSHSLVTGSNAYPGKVAFTYDAAGNILKVGDTSLTYSISGRISSKGSTSYTYDAFDRLIQSGDTVQYYYGLKVIQEVTGSTVNDFILHGKTVVAQVSDGKAKIFGHNSQSSIVSVTEGSTTAATTYGPFGTGDNGVRVGFNGEFKDVSDPNFYLLGNGTRTFMPGFGRFSSSDTLYMTTSEINPYAYCNADPVNASDPSGHSLGWNIFGMIAGIAGLVGAIFTGGSSLVVAAGIIGGISAIGSAALGFAADAEAAKGNDDLATTLGNVSLGLGLFGAILSFGATAGSVGKVAKVRSMFKGRKGKSFMKFMDDNDAISFKTNHSINFRSKSGTGGVISYREMKVSPDGVFRGKDIPEFKLRAGGKIRTTQAPIVKADLFTSSGNLRSLPSTLKQTGSHMDIIDFTWQNVPGTISSLVSAFSPSSSTEEPTPSSDMPVEASLISAYGIPTNSKSFYDDSSDEEEDKD